MEDVKAFLFWAVSQLTAGFRQAQAERVGIDFAISAHRSLSKRTPIKLSHHPFPGASDEERPEGL
jgi:hypothetical protein